MTEKLNIKKSLNLLGGCLLGVMASGFMTVANLYAQDAETAESKNSDQYEAFVNKTGNAIIQILVNKGSPLSSRKIEFRRVLNSQFDMNAIGKFVMSKYWRGLNEDQKQTFLKLFKEAVVENYAAQFDNYHNEKLDVRGSYETPDKGIVVQSHIIRPAGGPPLKVDWKIFRTKNGFKVLDIVVDGVSMSITLRSEYTGVFQSNGGMGGGGVEALFKYLRDKISSPSSSEDSE